MQRGKRKHSLLRLAIPVALMFLTAVGPDAARAQSISSSPRADIVLDLDGTLVDTLPTQQTGSFFAEGKWYRLRNFVPEFIDQLRKIPGIRISFFSGGNRDRNDVVLRQIVLADGKTAQEIAYRSLSFSDLTSISTDSSLRFFHRYKKDLRKVNPDLQKVIIIDDLREFSLPGQERNMLWLSPEGDSRERLQRALSVVRDAELGSRENPELFSQLVERAQRYRCEGVFL